MANCVIHSLFSLVMDTCLWMEVYLVYLSISKIAYLKVDLFLFQN